MGLVPGQRRIEDADNVQGVVRLHTMAIVRTDREEHARRESPRLTRGDLGHAAGAVDDIVRLPMVLVPEHLLHAAPGADIRQGKSHAVPGGQKAYAADLARTQALRHAPGKQPIERANEHGRSLPPMTNPVFADARTGVSVFRVAWT